MTRRIRGDAPAEVKAQLLSTEQVRQIALHPAFAGFTAALGGVAGLLGSVFPEDIKGAFPFAWGPDIIGKAVLFWASLLGFGVCFAVGFRSQLREQQRQSDRLAEGVESLKVAVSTMPSEAFLSEFEDYYSLVAAQLTAAESPGATQDDLRTSLSTSLMAMLGLAHTFDGSPKDMRYSANLMVFRPMPDERQEQGEVLARARFIEPNADPASVQGILELLPEFSISLSVGGIEADNETQAICLPIPRESHRKVGNKTAVLPGAPAAYCYPQSPAWWPDTLKIGSWCRDNSALRPDIANQIERYFEDSGSQVRSFISLPFGLPATDGGWEKIQGVVNIHADVPGILGEMGVRQFVPLTLPFRVIVARVWSRLSTSVGVANPPAASGP